MRTPIDSYWRLDTWVESPCLDSSVDSTDCDWTVDLTSVGYPQKFESSFHSSRCACALPLRLDFRRLPTSTDFIDRLHRHGRLDDLA